MELKEFDKMIRNIETQAVETARRHAKHPDNAQRWAVLQTEYLKEQGQRRLARSRAMWAIAFLSFLSVAVVFALLYGGL